MKTPRHLPDGPQQTAEPLSPSGDSKPVETVVPVLREELVVGKRRVDTGSGARVVKTVEERVAVVDEPLIREDVDVERVALNVPVDGPVEVRYEGDTMIVPVLEEVLVVEKRLVLKEEVRITRRKAEFREPQRVVVRHEHATVERIEGPDLDGSLAAQSVSPRDEIESAESLLERKRRQDEEMRQHVGSLRPPK